MPVCRPYYSVDPSEGAVYHNNSTCPVGRRIGALSLRDGIGIGHSLCAQCVELDLASWGAEPVVENDDAE